MKIISLTSFGFALFTAPVAVASPVDPDSLTPNGLDVRNENSAQAQYTGVSAQGLLVYKMEELLLLIYPQKCYKKSNQCVYTPQGGGTAICRCRIKMVTHL